MGIFTKKPKEDISLVVADAVTKALSGNPLISMAQTQATVNPQVNLPTTRLPFLAQTLARETETFGSQMGPGYPLIPMVIDPLNGARPDPRKYQYDISENLNISKRLPLWNVLKATAEQCDIVARCIIIRTSEMTKMSWDWTVSDDAITDVMDRLGVGSAEASKIAREENMEQIARLQEFWENPYPQSNRGWREFLSEMLYQILVYDGLAIHPAMNLGGQVIGFNIIDASTIKLLLDNYGDTPRPPDVAYQQILWGFPRGEFVASPDSDAKNFMAGEYGVTERDQLSYFVMNRRTATLYGWSPVEQCLEWANIYLERQKWLLSEYKHGTSANVYLKTKGNDITMNNLVAFERVYNDYLEGDTANRHRTKLLPEDWDPVFAPSVDERFKPDYDEALAKRISAFFGVSPQQLGIVARAGLGGGKGAAEGEQDNAEIVSARPMIAYIEEIVNSLSRRYLGATKAVTFILQESKGAEDELQKANAAKTLVSTGLKTLNGYLAQIGEPLYDMPEADEPMIITATGPVFLKGTLNEQISTQGEEGPSEEGEAPINPSEAPPTGVVPPEKAAEAKAFKKFASRPRTREFEFKHHTPEEAQVLKSALLGDTPKGSITSDLSKGLKKREAAAEKHKHALTLALAAGVTGITAAITHALGGASGAKAVNFAVRIDSTEAEKVLTSLYQDSAQAGAEAAATEVSSDPIMGVSVKQLLDQAGITLKGINGTTLDRMSAAIESGVQQGHSAETIAQAVDQIINDPARAQVIAVTEGNRAYNAATIDTYKDAGITQWEWNVYSPEDADCLDGEAENPHAIGDETPPAHPNCMCYITAITSGN